MKRVENLQVRKATYKDIPDIIKLYIQFHIEVEGYIPTEEEALKTVVSCMIRGILYIAYDNDNLIGMVGGTLLEDVFTGEFIYVKKSYRKKTLLLMFNALKEIKKKAKYIDVFCDDRQLKLWQKFGCTFKQHYLRRKL